MSPFRHMNEATLWCWHSYAVTYNPSNSWGDTTNKADIIQTAYNYCAVKNTFHAHLQKRRNKRIQIGTLVSRALTSHVDAHTTDWCYARTCIDCCSGCRCHGSLVNQSWIDVNKRRIYMPLSHEFSSRLMRMLKCYKRNINNEHVADNCLWQAIRGARAAMSFAADEQLETVDTSVVDVSTTRTFLWAQRLEQVGDYICRHTSNSVNNV